MQNKITKVFLPVLFLGFSFVGLVSAFYLTRINQDVRQQARIPDYDPCTRDSDCDPGYRCYGHTCLPVAVTVTPGAPVDTCSVSSSSLNSPQLYNHQAYASGSDSCGSCVADCSRTWVSGGVLVCYCEPVCSGKKDCTLSCSPCGNDAVCHAQSTPTPTQTQTQKTPTPKQKTPTPKKDDTPTPTEPVIGPQCHEVYLYLAPGGQIDLATGPLTGNMDSQLDVGTEVVFRCSNSLNGDGDLPSGYSYRFRVSAPCPDNPSQTCTTQGGSINPTNNGSLSQTYVIGANGAHSAQCAVCDQAGNCDWEN